MASGWPESLKIVAIDHDDVRGHRSCRDSRGAAPDHLPPSLARRPSSHSASGEAPGSNGSEAAACHDSSGPRGASRSYRGGKTTPSAWIAPCRRWTSSSARTSFAPSPTGSGNPTDQASRSPRPITRTQPEIVALGQSFAALLRLAQGRERALRRDALDPGRDPGPLELLVVAQPGRAWVERLPDARLRRVIDYLDASLASEISLGDLADVAGLSPNYFLTAFKKATGKTPHRFLTEKRVAKACELLSNPQLSLVNVALALGFSSQSHFTTVFGRFMKTTPASYRAQVLGLEPSRR